jgi:hypothetical protein
MFENTNKINIKEGILEAVWNHELTPVEADVIIDGWAKNTVNFDWEVELAFTKIVEE